MTALGWLYLGTALSLSLCLWSWLDDDDMSTQQKGLPTVTTPTPPPTVAQLYQQMLDAFALVKADHDKTVIDRAAAIDAVEAFLAAATPASPP